MAGEKAVEGTTQRIWGQGHLDQAEAGTTCTQYCITDHYSGAFGSGRRTRHVKRAVPWARRPAHDTTHSNGWPGWPMTKRARQFNSWPGMEPEWPG
jgi:hypothetical protein